jgi:hypothetical protein
MRDALVFNGASNLDFQDIRSNVIRIPEVVQRIRQAQEIWDKNSTMSLDLTTFIASEDNVFLGHIRLKGFATAVVQVGLLDRYLRNHKLPEFLIGASNGDAPLKVAAGQLSFEDMVLSSPALTGVATRALKPVSPVSSGLELPVLSGIQLVEYSALQRGEEGYRPVPSESKDLEKMVVELVENHDVEQLVMVGPGHSIFGRGMRELTERDVQVMESIDLDPMLAWFWSNLKESRLAVAN